LCDGTGDWGDGRRRSRIAVDTMVQMMIPNGDDPAQRLRDAMQLGGMKMCQTHSGEPWPEDFPPSCLASMLYIRDDAVHVAWIGDGPVFLIRGNDVAMKTRPHLLVDQAIAAGHLTPERAKDWPHKNVISRVVGGHGPNEVPRTAPETSGPWELLRGDAIVLCYRRVARTVVVGSLPGLVAGRSAETVVAKLLDVAESVDRVVETAAVVITAE
jgi:serine/threonine protein phosphatase PrpC